MPCDDMDVDLSRGVRKRAVDLPLTFTLTLSP
ncbi:hypothetical protein ABID08_001817 [Rhizobium binae]|uniref:Uncharacterized protein n=1 Tax=Rhizobium binae TaxID=1138190 RepID=A0ABV2MGF6_9HYPH